MDTLANYTDGLVLVCFITAENLAQDDAEKLDIKQLIYNKTH